MKHIQSWLVAVLVLQLVLAGGLYWNQMQGRQRPAEQALLEFDPNRVDRIVISDGDNEAELKRNGGTWQLPGMANLPVFETRLSDLLSSLQALEGGWPVATTRSAQARFEVADDNYQRRVRLYRGDRLESELFVGTSPGFRQVHVRSADDDAIYTAALNSYELPAKNADWLDRSLIAATAISKIQGQDFVLQKTGDDWILGDAEVNAADEPGDAVPDLNEARADELATALMNLRVQSLAENPPPTATPESAAKTIQVTDRAGIWTYSFSQVDDGFYVSRNDRDEVFSISKYDYDRITQIDRKQLAQQADTKPEQPSAEHQADDSASGDKG